MHPAGNSCRLRKTGVTCSQQVLPAVDRCCLQPKGVACSRQVFSAADMCCLQEATRTFSVVNKMC